MPCINNLNEESWKTIVSRSNETAMKKSHRYPEHEELFFVECLDYVDTNCSDICSCRKLNSDKVWVLKEDLDFDIFLKHYANLWVRGSNSFKEKVINDYINIGKRDKNSVPILRYVKSKWFNWDGEGNTLPSLANKNRKTVICCDGFSVVNQVFDEIKKNTNDTTGVYSSKLLSQLFPDIAIPYDTESSKKMKYCGYIPMQLGYGKIRNQTIEFLNNQNLSINNLRLLDNSVSCCWPNSGKEVMKIGIPTTYSRVIDKLFYSQ